MDVSTATAKLSVFDLSGGNPRRSLLSAAFAMLAVLATLAPEIWRAFSN